MVDALSDPITDHIGRQLLHWFVGYSSSWYSTLSGSEFIDNFKKLESGASILEQGLGIKFDEEEEAQAAVANCRRRDSSRRSRNDNNEGSVNREGAWRFLRRDDPIVEYGERNYENLMLVDIMENCEEGIPVEMFNVLAPFHQNSGAAAAATGGATAPGNQNGPAGGGGAGRGGGVENMQVTQPCSAPSSPTITSPGALSSTSFCLPTGANGGSSTSSGGSSVITSTTATDTGDPNWQATKSTVRERNAAMFNNDLMADIRFIVGTDEQVQTIPAHKYVLATGSSVFYAMFYGGLAENKQEIKVPDVEPNAFLTLLKYLYCDEIHLEADNVLATLYVAKKYIVPHLARACVNYLETSLTAKNACLLLSQSRLFEEPELMQRCWEVIDAQVCESTANLEVVDRDGTHFITGSAPTTITTSLETTANTSRILNLPPSSPPPLCSPQQSPCFQHLQSSPTSPSTTTSNNGTEGNSSVSSSATVSSSVSTSSLSTSEMDPSV